jgi:DNA repair protein RadC
VNAKDEIRAANERDSGISVIGSVPLGSQLCVLHDTKSDLFNTIAQFFSAGLKSNERCEIVHAKESGIDETTITGIPELTALVPYLKTGQLELPNRVRLPFEDRIPSLLGKVKETVDKGYEGLRIAGDVTGNGKEFWLESIQSRIESVKHLKGAPILGLSAYPLDRLGASDIITLTNIIPYVFIVRKGKLSLVDNYNDPLRWDTSNIGRKGRFSIIHRLMKTGHEKQQYLDNAAVILLATDPYGKVTHINTKGCEAVGYSKNEIIGKNWFDNFVPPRVGIAFHDINEKHLSGEEKATDYHEGPILTKSGEERLIAWYTAMIRDHSGKVISVYSTGIDITERKQEEESRKMLLRPNPDGSLMPLQEKYINTGLHEFNDKEIIELFFSLNLPLDVARGLADTCMKKYHSLREFLAAPVPHLQRLGIPRSCIFSLKLIHELPVRILKEEIMNQPVFSSSQDIFNYLYYSMRDLTKEVFKVIYLNIRNQIIEIADIYEGSVEKINFSAQEVIESALEHGAKSLVVVHNHPSGDPDPSQADKRLTRDLIFIGSLLQIKILDHIIIGENIYCSFADEGLIKEYEIDFLNLKLTGTSEAKRGLSQAWK